MAGLEKLDFDRGFVTRVLADNFGSGLSNFFPMLLTKERSQPSLGGKAGDSGPEANLSDKCTLYIQAAGVPAPDIFFHSVGVLHASSYRPENASALRQDWPRIPLPDSKVLLLASAALGRKLAALLDTEAQFEAAPPLQRIGVPVRIDGKPLNGGQDLAVTAGWGHAGKGGVTMPGKGRLVERDYTPEERGELLGDHTCDVCLNDAAYWKNIPIRVWEYTIGGYQVIKQWLSYREEKLLGRPLRKDEVRWVQEMARRIAAIVLLEPTLDQNYRAAKERTYSWQPAGPLRDSSQG